METSLGPKPASLSPPHTPRQAGGTGLGLGDSQAAPSEGRRGCLPGPLLGTFAPGTRMSVVQGPFPNFRKINSLRKNSETKPGLARTWGTPFTVGNRSLGPRTEWALVLTSRREGGAGEGCGVGGGPGPPSSFLSSQLPSWSN